MTDTTKKAASPAAALIAIPIALTTVFVTSKLAGWLDVSWLWALSPILLYLALAASAIYSACVAQMALEKFVDAKLDAAHLRFLHSIDNHFEKNEGDVP